MLRVFEDLGLRILGFGFRVEGLGEDIGSRFSQPSIIGFVHCVQAEGLIFSP